MSLKEAVQVFGRRQTPHLVRTRCHDYLLPRSIVSIRGTARHRQAIHPRLSLQLGSPLGAFGFPVSHGWIALRHRSIFLFSISCAHSLHLPYVRMNGFVQADESVLRAS